MCISLASMSAYEVHLSLEAQAATNRFLHIERGYFCVILFFSYLQIFSVIAAKTSSLATFKLESLNIIIRD